MQLGNVLMLRTGMARVLVAPETVETPTKSAVWSATGAVPGIICQLHGQDPACRIGCPLPPRRYPRLRCCCAARMLYWPYIISRGIIGSSLTRLQSCASLSGRRGKCAISRALAGSLPLGENGYSGRHSAGDSASDRYSSAFCMIVRCRLWAEGHRAVASLPEQRACNLRLLLCCGSAAWSQVFQELPLCQLGSNCLEMAAQLVCCQLRQQEGIP